MCGICGIFDLRGVPVPYAVLRKMTDVMKHRGPDGEGFWIDKNLGFGHRRLAILDLSPAGNQPMQTEDGRFVITYNGEVYNYLNLRTELEAKGFKFYSNCDTEVVLKAFQQWGNDAIKKFNGMFAFAIWDNKEKTLTLARDRYGIKPLYYFFDGKVLVFASEIKAILQYPTYQTEVCCEALNEYFTFQNVFSDHTLFKGIKLLLPARILQISLNHKSPKVTQYWDYYFRDELDCNEYDCEEELTILFEQAVNRQLVSDVEIGSYLSGGMDSGSITCIAAKIFKNLKTFTCGFDLSSASGLELSFDERAKADFLSNKYKTEHYEIVLKAGDMERVMPDLIWHLEDLRVGQSYPNFYIARLASKFVKVVLSGVGGDELFAGYPWRYYRALVNASSDEYVDKYYQYWSRLIPDERKVEFFQPEVYRYVSKYSTKDVFKLVINGKNFEISTPEEYINRSLYFEIKTFLNGLLIVEDKLSMAHSLETRVPFLDNDLVEFAMKVPVKYKLKNLTEVIRINENDPIEKNIGYYKTNDGKLLLRRVLSKYVPEMYTQGFKQGFSAPDASWFKGESIDYIKNLLFNQRARIYDYLNPNYTKQLLTEHFSGKVNHRLLIWSLLNFEWWLKIFKP
jgi:asparagine synthase (glutamine-hydrolysing)